MTTKNIRFHPLDKEDVPRMAEMENAAWGPLGAGADTIRRRLSLGHTMIAASVDDLVAGAICFVETNQDPHDTAKFPKTFSAYSSMGRSEPALSLYVYNLGVRPEFRGTDIARRLLSELIEHGRRVGARWLVGDGRCPSYAGAQHDTPDKVLPDQRFRATIDDWHRTGVTPPVKSIIRDPLLRFYRRVLNCEFLHLAPGFLPEDASSGGYRVIFAVDVTQ
ncbi:MAG: GNAT family N-acetyltransferase [Mesorhizobium sp.]|uniref:GNAT family N-acetyltransferase n=1 Tax=Mesorhizobium sp. TaxID=1871066 RepID=UPI000FE64126|nr:GNAT family N-acetyltransferase [Mesorhizobium sp.]RWQ36640.1 MAG: N-acetyltransferase [Mesorhizobium sp.]TIL22254.1 MAG: GNAT family N-acetyltransferase [Mesorhizobium sp.]